MHIRLILSVTLVATSLTVSVVTAGAGAIQFEQAPCANTSANSRQPEINGPYYPGIVGSQNRPPKEEQNRINCK